MLTSQKVLKPRVLERAEVCESPKELITSKSFGLFLERFCTLIARKETDFGNFLDVYFNDQGYRDIWRIPNLLLDIYNGRMQNHKDLMDDENFRRMLSQLVSRFYNYCMQKESFLKIKESNFNHKIDYNSNLYHIKKKQLLFNLITEVYCTVMDKISAYK